MFNALKKILRIQTANHSTSTSISAPLFSGSAYFSNRVPRAFSEKWVAHGGEICSGTTLDVRARYFFATDPSEPWVTKLAAKSVMVIHAGWIVHCVDHAFQVPIAEYILDDRFVPRPPYKLTGSFAPSIYVPLSEPEEPAYEESDESRSTSVRTSDTPSTPTSMPRKRKREQAYFDSPSGSLVFSGFDKYGIPLRPRKLRKLRFDPSFSPEGGRSGGEAMWVAEPDWSQDYHALGNGGKLGRQHGQGGRADALGGCLNTMRSGNIPDEPLASEGPSATRRRISVEDSLSKSAQAPKQAVSPHKQEVPPVRTIDFTRLPPPTRRWRFPIADGTKSQDTSAILSIVKATDNKVKTPKKISFADHARLCVYPVSPPRPDAKDDVDIDCRRHHSSEGLEGRPEVMAETQVPREDAKISEKVIEDLAPHTGSLRTGDDPARISGEDQSENDTLTLTMEEVQAMRHRLLESAAKNGVDHGQFATLFEPGKTFQGKAFDHVW